MGSLLFVAFQEFIDPDKFKKNEVVDKLKAHILRNPFGINVLKNYVYKENSLADASIPVAVAEIIMETKKMDEAVLHIVDEGYPLEIDVATVED